MIANLKHLEWQDRNIFPHDVCDARREIGGGWMDGYSITRSEKYGGFNVNGLLKHREGTDDADTLEEAKAIAEDDYQRRQRAIAWREYMETHEVPGLGKPQ